MNIKLLNRWYLNYLFKNIYIREEANKFTEALLWVGDGTSEDFSVAEVDSIRSAEVGCDSIIPSLPKDACASLVSIGSSFGLSFKSVIWFKVLFNIGI